MCVKQLVIDESKIAKNAVLFRAKHLVDGIFIRKDLVQKIKGKGFTGFSFWEVSDYKN